MNTIVLRCKYKFEGLPNIVMTIDDKIWRLPYKTIDGKNMNLKEIKEIYHQGQNKYRIWGKFYTLNGLNCIAYNFDEIINTGILTNKPFNYGKINKNSERVKSSKKSI